MIPKNQINKNSFVSIGLVISFIFGSFWGGYELGRLKTDVNAMKEHLEEMRSDIKEIKNEIVLIRLNK